MTNEMTKTKKSNDIKKRSQLKSIWFRFKKNKLAILGMALLVFLIAVAIVAPLLADYEADAIKQNMKERLQPPSKEHIFGTDRYGRDVFARVVFGARVSLSIGLASILISLIIGTLIGAVSGYYGGRVDNILMRLMDIFLAIPQMLLAISIVGALGPGILNLLIAMIIPNIPKFARIVRASILSIKGQEFIEAARACGTRDRRIIGKHIIPNAVGPIIVQATLSIAHTIIATSSLSFLGLGVKAPMPEWGAMLSEGKEYMRHYPYLIMIPGIAIVLTVMALNLMGDGLRDALDPRLKN